MFIASKYQDIYPMRLKVIQEKIAHGKLSCEDIKKREEEIMKFLDYIILMMKFIGLSLHL